MCGAGARRFFTDSPWQPSGEAVDGTVAGCALQYVSMLARTRRVCPPVEGREVLHQLLATDAGTTDTCPDKINPEPEPELNSL
jgi:hypothetical protein